MNRQLILSRAAAAGVPLDEAQALKFCAYHGMIVEANKQFNLTRVPDEPEEAVDRNYIDSIAPIALSVFDGAQSIVDVGSGAGFPGIPLAIALPQVHFTLLDSLNKRVVFLNEVIEALSLNAEAVHIRAEDAAKLPAYARRFDVAVARAVAPMKLLGKYLPPLVRPGGIIAAYKGPSLPQELEEAEGVLKKYRAGAVNILDVPIPGRDWTHKLAVMKVR